RLPLHLDQPVDDPAVSVKAEATRSVKTQRHDGAIGFARKPTVQPKFLLAEEPAAGQRAEIKEGILDRLLELVDAVPGKENPRHMGFLRLDGGRCARIG